MSVTYKDIDQLAQKPEVAGTEKLPVSDTQYITPDQIVDGCPTMEEAGLTEVQWQNITPTARIIASNGNWANPTGQTKSVLVQITPLKTYRVVAYDSTVVAVLTSGTYGAVGTAASFATGFTSRTVLNGNDSYSFTSPSDGNYLYLTSTDYTTGEQKNIAVICYDYGTPIVSAADNGKALMVVSGKWAAQHPSALNYAKYEVVSTLPVSPDSGTLYLIPES